MSHVKVTDNPNIDLQERPWMLVAYATKHGATAEIAEVIGRVLRESGLPTDVLPVAQVDDLTTYEGVVLGSAVYMGRWRREATRFLKQHEAVLAKRPLWIFSSGPTDEGDPAELVDGWQFPEPLRPVIERLQPRNITVFHGALDLDTLAFWEKWIIKRVNAPVGDFRDWEMITEWATAVAEGMQEKVGV